MRPHVMLVALAALAILAALPLGKGHGEEEGAAALAKDASAWPCCDHCGVCTRSLPPICRCRDTSPSGCNPACKNCVESSGSDGAPVFECTDFITDFCKRSCTPGAAAAAA